MLKNIFKNTIIKRIFIALLVIGGILFWAFYHAPTKIYASGTTVWIETLSRVDHGRTIDVDLELEIWKYFFKPDIIKGYINFDGVRYMSSATWTRNYNSDKTIIENIKDKISGHGKSMLFRLYDENHDFDTITSDMLMLYLNEDGSIEIFKKDDDKGIGGLYLIEIAE